MPDTSCSLTTRWLHSWIFVPQSRCLAVGGKPPLLHPFLTVAAARIPRSEVLVPVRVLQHFFFLSSSFMADAV
jgi:hypothetical protein